VHYVTKAYGRGDVYIHIFLTSALYGFTPRLLYPRGNRLRYPLDRRLSEPRNRSGRCGEENILPYRESKPGRPSRSPSLYRLSYYGLDDRGVKVRFPVGSRIFSLCRPNWLWGPPRLLSNGYRQFFPRVKAAGSWSWPVTSNYCREQGNVDPYILSSIRLHGIVLN
jgi:hypothetical protein